MADRPDVASAAPRQRILVAEDEPLVRSWLRRALEHAGYEVLEAEDGRRAAEILAVEPVDLLITDLWMPRMNGVELIEVADRVGWHATDPGREPEIVVLSAHVTGASTDKLTGLGVFRTLTKPIESEALLGVVAEAMASDRRARLARERPAQLSAACPASTHRGMVLVADDDEGIRSLLNTALTGAGYDVVEAVDGEEAVEKALAYDIDLILMDLNMPRMNGCQAVAALKQATRDCFIICATGECGQAEIDRVMQAGAMSLFRKPFEIFELMAEVERLDLIASHRRKLAERERARAAAEEHWTVRTTTVAWVREQRHRYGRRFKLVVALAALVVIGATVAVPYVYAFTQRAAAAAKATADRINGAADAASRVEGYLQRDEAREVDRTR